MSLQATALETPDTGWMKKIASQVRPGLVEVLRSTIDVSADEVLDEIVGMRKQR
jgi:hypothetical protein